MLIDPFGRRVDYLRVSVTDRCDLRCFYCLPKGASPAVGRGERLSPAQIERIVRCFVRLGVRKIRLTGGEPLTRADLPEIARRIGAIEGIADLALSTNATRLAELAGTLRDAGVRRLNVSLDSLDPERFAAITCGGDLGAVLAGLAAARAAGFAPIKINTVVMQGINDHEIERIVAFCGAHGFLLRLIETMPVGEAGRRALEHYLPLEEVERRLAERHTLIVEDAPADGPARYLRIGEGGQRIGLITPLSRHFCATCNRLRLTADGLLHPCLDGLGAVPLRETLGDGTDNALERAIRRTLLQKPQGHRFHQSQGRPVRLMAYTGG